MTINTIDFRKDRAYKPKTEPEVINIPEMLFVVVEGEGGDPEKNPQFQEAMQIIFASVYTIKFWDKKHATPPGYAKFKIAPLEGLWWTKSGHDFDTKKPKDWKWLIMMRLPNFVTSDYFQNVIDELVNKKQSDIYKKARLEHFTEGLCTQIMHIGPYDAEQSDIDKMHVFAKENGYTLTGKHHELYFGDPRRTKPEKPHTILRHPIKKYGKIAGSILQPANNNGKPLTINQEYNSSYSSCIINTVFTRRYLNA